MPLIGANEADAGCRDTERHLEDADLAGAVVAR